MYQIFGSHSRQEGKMSSEPNQGFVSGATVGRLYGYSSLEIVRPNKQDGFFHDPLMEIHGSMALKAAQGLNFRIAQCEALGT